ncbi:hypothetical protein GCM10009730_55050 [Streptomyces albidochromogenes]
MLQLAPRRSGHVTCAGGGAVLNTDAMSIREESRRWVVNKVSHQSTGYCLDVSSWPPRAARGPGSDRDRLGLAARIVDAVASEGDEGRARRWSRPAEPMRSG